LANWDILAAWLRRTQCAYWQHGCVALNVHTGSMIAPYYKTGEEESTEDRRTGIN